MDMNQTDQVVKGGVTWFNLGITRGKRGLNFWIKADPRLEDFVKSLGNGNRDNLEAYMQGGAVGAWFPLDSSENLLVYRIDEEVSNQGYTISKPCEPLRLTQKIAGDGKLNLSYLRFVGISSPNGVRFGVAGPFSKQYVDKLKIDILLETKNLIRDYIAPININLRISGTEV